MTLSFRQKRILAGLSVNECAELLCMHPISIRRFECDPDTPTHKEPSELALKMLHLYTVRKAPRIIGTEKPKKRRKKKL